MVRRSVAEIERMMRERDPSSDFPVRGLRVGRLWLDQGFALELHPSRESADEGALLRLYSSFELHTVAERRELDATAHTTLIPAFSLLGRHVDAAAVLQDGSFDLRLDDGSRIVAPPDAEFEQWEFAQPWPPAPRW